jgi:hypothetical protein
MQHDLAVFWSISFHYVEVIFNCMILCNIYHTAARKIRLSPASPFANVEFARVCLTDGHDDGEQR